MPEAKRAVAYYRMSTDRQEASIPDQYAEVVGYAARNGFTIIREYQDNAEDQPDVVVTTE